MNNYFYSFYQKSSFFIWLYQKSFLSKPLHMIKQSWRFVFFKTSMLCEYLQTVPRHFGAKDKRFEPLRKLKDKYKGKRCFITCTGPSLTIEDLESLENEYVFGMNSICLIHDKTSWKPDFFGIQDGNVYVRVKDILLKTDNGLVFAPIKYKNKYGTPDNWIYFHMCGSYHLYEMDYDLRYFAKFSDDCYETVYDGYSITYTIIQLAVYMGFDELYLIGADCSYLGEKQHFIEHGNSNPAFEAKASKRLFASYGEAKKYADEHGIKIFNATKGGCLEIFERVNLDEVLKDQKKNKSN